MYVYCDNSQFRLIHKLNCFIYRGGSLSALDLTCLGGTVDPGGLLLDPGERIIQQVPESITITGDVPDIVGSLDKDTSLEIQENHVPVSQSKDKEPWSPSPPINKKVYKQNRLYDQTQNVSFLFFSGAEK